MARGGVPSEPEPPPGGVDKEEEFVLRSGVRSGLKREFVFALKSQAELLPMGRTRSGKARRFSSYPTPPTAAAELPNVLEQDAALAQPDEPALTRNASSTSVEAKPEPEPEPEVQHSRGTSEVETSHITPVHTSVKSAVKTEDADGTDELEVQQRLASDIVSPAADAPSARVSSSTSGVSVSVNEESEDQKPSREEIQNMGVRMSNNVALTKIPKNIRELFATGLLEGMPVKYISTRSKGVFCGIIKDTSILCLCSSCNGKHTFSAYNFEIHAGSTNKHPSDFIYIENGKNIHDVLRECANVPINMLKSAIRFAVSLNTDRQTHNCQSCNGIFQPTRSGILSTVCDDCLVKRLSPLPLKTPKPAKSTRDSKSTIDLDSSKNPSKFLNSHKKSAQGRMTTKDLRLHKLVFMNNILPDGTEVAYYSRGQRLLEGYIKESGIFCSCCSSVVSPSQFEAHAGWATRRKPYLNIYTSNGVSLHELSVSLAKDKKVSTSESDDLCQICADGGDLLLCDLCPRAYHKECVGLSTVPTDDWYCPRCRNMNERENYVKHNENAIAAGRQTGVDPIEQIYKQCIRIIQTPETDASSCVLCRGHDFSRSGFGPRTVILCDQCEKEFHVGCLKEYKMDDLEELPEGKWFCCSDCGRIHETLLELLSSGLQQLPYLALDNIKKRHIGNGLSGDIPNDVKWGVLHGKMGSSESRLLLSQTISILHESFGQIDDPTTGKDLIPAMVYGKEMRDQDFSGMYCAVLTVNSTVQSVGIFRVLGSDVAEVPLVATISECRGSGYFRSLFLCIEQLLSTLGVKHLVLPAAEEAEAIWTTKFGFTKITKNMLEDYAKGARPMAFQGTPMLHKVVSSAAETSAG